MTELHPLHAMEDDIHGVRELLEIAMEIIGDQMNADGLDRNRSEQVQRLIRCADEKNAAVLAKWEKAFEGHKNERADKCWLCDSPIKFTSCSACGAPAFPRKFDQAA